MRYLITGGAGFIGSHMCGYMTEAYQNDMIFCLDKLTYAANFDRITDLKKLNNFVFLNGDITDKDFVFNTFEGNGFDVVINFAAESHVTRSISDPEIFCKSNVNGVQTLLEACRTYGIQRFHQVSTDEVYGASQGQIATESSKLNPSTPYSSSKAAADLLVMSYYQTYGLPVTISRASNNYGIYQHPEKLIPLMVLKAVNNEPLTVHGDGKMFRNWLHVRDHCIGIDCILQRGNVGEIYNVSGQVEKSVNEIVELILKRLDKPTSLIQYVPNRKGNDQRYLVSSDKLKALGWSEKYDFALEILKTIDWYGRANNAKVQE